MSIIEKLFSKHGAPPDAAEKPAALAAVRPASPALPASMEGPDHSNDRKDPAPQKSDIEALIEEFSQIESVLTEDEAEQAQLNETRLTMPLAALLAVLPDACRTADAAAPDPGQCVQIVIKDLYEQLAAGKVSVRLVDVLAEVPERYLAPDFADHLEDRLTLPLSLLVQHIPPEQLERHRSRREREPGIENFPDIFSPHGIADAQAGVEQAVPLAPPEPEPAPSPGPAESAPVSEEPLRAPSVETGGGRAAEAAPQEPVPAAQPAPAAAEPAPVLMLHHIDLNAAPPRLLCKALPGVGPKMAERMLKARPFSSVFDLERVEGLGPRTFKRITGHARPSGKEALACLQAILGDPDAARPLPRDVAQRLAALRGVRGCVISHREGHLLAAEWRQPQAEALSAIAPQLLKSMDRYMDDLQRKGLSSLAVFVDPYPLYLVRAEDLVLTVCMARSAFSMRRMEMFEALAWELVRRLHAHPEIGRTERPD